MGDENIKFIPEAFGIVFGYLLPVKPYEYTCTYKNVYDSNKDNILVKMLRDFEEVCAIAYHSSGYFTCSGLNDDEKRFIDDILEYKITQKLKN